jgi:hypothetical protein
MAELSDCRSFPHLSEPSGDSTVFPYWPSPRLYRRHHFPRSAFAPAGRRPRSQGPETISLSSRLDRRARRGKIRATGGLRSSLTQDPQADRYRSSTQEAWIAEGARHRRLADGQACHPHRQRSLSGAKRLLRFDNLAQSPTPALPFISLHRCLRVVPK